MLRRRRKAALDQVHAKFKGRDRCRVGQHAALQVRREERAAKLTDERDHVGTEPGKDESPLVGPPIARSIAGQRLDGAQERRPVRGRQRLALLVCDARLAKQALIIKKSLRMHVQRQAVKAAVPFNRCQDMR